MMRSLIALLIGVTLVPATLRAADDKAVDEASADRARLELFATSSPAARPAVLPALYGTFAGLQIYDGYATFAGVHRGVHEANGFIGGLAGKPAALWTMKAASTGVSIYLAERLWRDHHRGQAIAVMIASNAVMSVVAARNAHVLTATR